MDKLFEQIAKILPPPLLMGLLGICVVFFATFYARGYRAYGDVLQDGFFRNSVVMIAAIAFLFWVNTGRGMRPAAKPVLIVPFFASDEREQYRIAFSTQIEGQLNEALRTNTSIFNLPSYINDPETAKQVARKYGASAVIYAATVIDTKDSRAACFKLMLVDPELSKTYSLVPMSMPQGQLGEIINTLRGTLPLVGSSQTVGSDTNGRVDSLEAQIRAIGVELAELRRASADKRVESKTLEALKTPLSRHAIVIGIGRYQSPEIPSLALAQADASAVNDTLIRLGFQSSMLQDSTRAAILETLSRAGSALKDRDLLIVYLTGHMTAAEFDGTRTLVILPADVKPGASMLQSGISITELVQVLSRSSSGNILLILDGCSGVAGLDRAQFRRRQANGNFVIIASTGDNQVAVESAEMGGAVFTRTLVKVLADLGSDRTGPIGLSEVFTRVSALMQSETQRMRIEQAPQMIDLWGSGDLILRDSAPPHSPSLAELTR